MSCRVIRRLVFRPLAIAVLLSIALQSGCSSAPPLPAPPKQLPPNDDLIVPGNRIGPVAIGMTSKQVLEAKGTPGDSTFRYTDAAVYPYDQNEYSVVVDDVTQQVWRVETSSDEYRTAEGVGVGQSELEMRANLGNPNSATNEDNADPPTFLYCYDKGLAIYTFRGKIFKISVFNPGNTCK
ncbi:MAG TPA: hypothetical protein VGR71_08610 [Nitrospira sp.]|nr:hypothetical protein [Nitrospira sp.]